MIPFNHWKINIGMILVTSGCSFSECTTSFPYTWPMHLQEYLGCEHHSCAMRSQGNGLIMRRLLYTCDRLLKTNQPDDILVGVMWSGPDRFDFYTDEKIYLENPNGWDENPVSFIDDDPGGWVILNHHWDMELARQYYGNFHNAVYSQWLTLEHILHTQWYMEKHGIRYFMMPYISNVFPTYMDHHPQLEWLYEQIDFDSFVTREGCLEWCRDNGSEKRQEEWFHPSPIQHLEYTEKMIIPYLRKNGMI